MIKLLITDLLIAPTMLHTTFAQVMQRIYQSGCITRRDENYLLRTTVAAECLTAEEHDQIRDLHQRLQMGLLHVVD